MNVLILGDSFVFGHGCSDRIFYFDHDNKTYVGERLDGKSPSAHCWSSLLQQEFSSLNIYNQATVGRSMQGMLYDIIEWLEYHPKDKLHLIIFNGTVSDRVEFPMIHDHSKTGSWGISWINSFPDRHPSEPDELHKAKQVYAKYLYNNRIGDQLSFSALGGAYALATLHNVKFLWSMPGYGFYDQRLFEHFDAISDLEIPSLWGYDFSNNKDKDFNKNFLCKDGHANNLGHKIYYEKEIQFKIKNLLGV